MSVGNIGVRQRTISSGAFLREATRAAILIVAQHANHYFATLADLEHVVAQRCRILNGDQLKPGTSFHGWPKPDIPKPDIPA